jgi:hypothetical protein
VNAEKDVLAADGFATLADPGHRYAEVQIYGPDEDVRSQLSAAGITFQSRPGDAP